MTPWTRAGRRGSSVAKPKKKRAPQATKILPMELRPGDRIADETGEWEVIGLPYSAAGGKIVQVRVQRAGHDRAGFRTYGAHELVSVNRAAAEEGKR
jgi:hypothetical protein